MEPDSEIQSNENEPLINNQRNALRGTVFQSILQASEGSSLYLSLSLIYSLSKILAISLVIALAETHTSEPLITFVIILLSVESLSALINLSKILRLYNENLRMKDILAKIEFLGLLTYLTGLVLGNIWFYSCDDCFDDAYQLTTLSLVLIIFGYIYLCMPLVLCVCVCLCLPVLIIIMIYAQPNGQRPATEQIINKLKVNVFKAETNLNKECVICFQHFEEGEEIICLDCDERHSFHSECLKKWLRINSICPICRKSIT